MTIEAIPTIYRGIEYASRLEARWAIFFTQARMKFRYEPHGRGSLPDFEFFLAGVESTDDCEGLLLEVKGQPPNKNYIKLLQDKGVDYIAIGGFFKGTFPVLLRLQPFVESVVLLKEFSDYSKFILSSFNSACTYRFDLV